MRVETPQIEFLLRRIVDWHAAVPHWGSKAAPGGSQPIRRMGVGPHNGATLLL